MRYRSALSPAAALILGLAAATGVDSHAQAPRDFSASIQVTVTNHDGTPLAGAVVRIDLNNDGLWDEGQGEPQAVTGPDGGADFAEIVAIQDPGGEQPGGASGWQPLRIMMGNVRGSAGASEVAIDFVLPCGISMAGLGLYDLRGRRIAHTDGAGDLALRLPGSLPHGMYVLRLSAEPAAPVSQKITSVGQRTLAINAKKVSVDEAVAAGWAEQRALAGKQESRDDGHPVTIMVSHVEFGGMNRTATITPEENSFLITIPEAPEGFVHIPSGRFMMGSPEDEPGRWEQEGPQHRVTLTQGFYMSRHEVTEALWHQVMGGTATDPQTPRSYVSWDMAVQFCNALSALEGLSPAYTIGSGVGNVTWNPGADGYRLATEAEWEYACRAGSAAAFTNGPITHQNCDPLDPNLDAVGWYCGNRITVGPSEAGLKQANAWGVHDMHGNLSEWVWCGWRTYSSGAQVDPVTSPGAGADRVIRGGQWGSIARGCRSAFRTYDEPDNQSDNGIRLVRSAF